MSTEPVPAAMTRANIEAVQKARVAILADSVMVPMPYLRDLLTAYDVLAARVAWLAARFTEVEIEMAVNAIPPVEREIRRRLGEDV